MLSWDSTFYLIRWPKIFIHSRGQVQGTLKTTETLRTQNVSPHLPVFSKVCLAFDIDLEGKKISGVGVGA